jgi:hypothetical protein
MSALELYASVAQTDIDTAKATLDSDNVKLARC